VFDIRRAWRFYQADGASKSRSLDRTQFLADRANMMQEWGDYLDKLRTGADVIQFKKA
jgi:hypothetical protein